MIALYALPIAGIIAWYVLARLHAERAYIQAAREAIEASMTEPPSLHPVIDPTLCIGCRSCLAACPEQGSHPVLGMIRGKARLVGPSNCIGHGACEKACPEDAITLVFGTAKRGVDIPLVNPDFETNVPGIFIAGELGGMGLIRNAVEQGRQAMDSIINRPGIGQEGALDVVIVGAGPAGFSASLGAMKAGLRFVTIEQDSLGGAVAHFPRGKLVMTRPAELPIIGTMKFSDTTKEELLQFWQGVEVSTGLKINYDERVTGIERQGDNLVVNTTQESYRTRSVLLTIGRRGTPRQLGVPGEEKSKVVYRLIDAAQFEGQHVLVVGGGDSALEAAHSIAEQPRATVMLSYRSEAFTRAKPGNRDKVESLSEQGRLRVLMSSNVREIQDDEVVLEQGGKLFRFRNDSVIVCAGGILPTGFLKDIGIDVETKFGTA
jgi:thioredoxin reductase/ferredoxin